MAKNHVFIVESKHLRMAYNTLTLALKESGLYDQYLAIRYSILASPEQSFRSGDTLITKFDTDDKQQVEIIEYMGEQLIVQNQKHKK